MRRWFGLLIAALFGLITVNTSYLVQAEYYANLCPNENAEFYQPNLFPKNDVANNRRLLLADWSTGKEVRVLRTDTQYSYGYSWSPNCRYLVGYINGYYNYGECIDLDGLIIWDAVTGEEKTHLKDFCDTLSTGYPHVYWKPDSSLALLTEWFSGWNSEGSVPDRLFWNSATNTLTKMNGDYELYNKPNLFQVEWDDNRHWVWTSGNGAIYAFDYYTAQLVAHFENKGYPPGDKYKYKFDTVSYFSFSPDRSKVITYGQSTDDKLTAPAMHVYDIASGQGVEVNVELNSQGLVALSTDNRYLVMNYLALRVWDLQNLPEKVEDRLPIHRYKVGFVQSLRFMDATTLETKSGDNIQRWDILTGKLIP